MQGEKHRGKRWGKGWGTFSTFFVFFASGFISKTSYSRGIWSHELEGRGREQNEDLMIQIEIFRDLLYHLNTNRSMGLDRIQPSAEGAAGRSCQVTFNKLSVVLSNQGVPSWLEVGECANAHLLKRRKRTFREWWAYQSDLSAREGHGVILNVITWHVQDNQVTKPSQHGFMNVKSCLTSLIFYEKMTHLVDRGKTVHIIWTIENNLILFVTAFFWVKYCLTERIVHWIKIG